MALGSGKSIVLANLEAKRNEFVDRVMQAEDDMSDALLASRDPAQNDAQRKIKWNKIFTEFKKIEETFFDSIVDEIKNNAIVNQGISVTIPATSGPGTPSTGSTTTTGKIS